MSVARLRASGLSRNLLHGLSPPTRSYTTQAPSPPDLKLWVGKQLIERDHVRLGHVQQIACIADWFPPASAFSADTTCLQSHLPFLWHWCLFPSVLPPNQLAKDGYERFGDYLPPIDKIIESPLRMWAGGEVKMLRPIQIGNDVKRVRTIESVTTKTGRSGTLIFVRENHEIFVAAQGKKQEELAISEKQDLVYRARPLATAASSPGPSASEEPAAAKHKEKSSPFHSQSETGEHAVTWTQTVSTTPLNLFRYSALSWNSHRIHYDSEYARTVEGYPDVLVHGPFLATCLATAFQQRTAEHMPKAPQSMPNGVFRTTGSSGLAFRYPTVFDYRAKSPVFTNSDFAVNISYKTVGDAEKVQNAHAFIVDRSGKVAMSGTFS